jgi:hypothetical protein
MLHKIVRGIAAAVVAGALLAPAPAALAAPNRTDDGRLAAPSSALELVSDWLSTLLGAFSEASPPEPDGDDDEARVDIDPDGSNLTEPTAEPTAECGPYIDPHG